MTVQQLIAELAKLPPHLPVRGFMSTVTLTNDPLEDIELHPSADEAQEVTSVTWRGYDVCLDCDGTAAG